jgi:hypothetical protein
MFEFELPERFRRYVPLIVWLLVPLVLLIIPLKILGLGYLPGDDALRHVAKAVSGKSWPEILVVGSNFKMDHNLGWHALLGAIDHVTNWGVEPLLVFCVVTLFFIVNTAMLPWLKRPEAWLAALILASLLSDEPGRFMLGRPFVLTVTVLMTLLFAVQKRLPDWRMFLLFTAALTLCTFFHGVWYLWVLPVMAFFFAGQFRWTALLTLAWMTGALLAALLTGHPVVYLSQAVEVAFSSVGQHSIGRTEVGELQPFAGDILAVFTVGALVALRLMTRPAMPLARNPAFWLMCGSWLLGFRVCRFWEDWGWPSLMVWIASEVDFLLLTRFAADSLRRLLLALILALAAFMAVTGDAGSRWTQSLTTPFLSVADHPELEGWMPDPGGILYSADMAIFYRTFYKNPHGGWRYQLGYEPTLMPQGDFETYQKIIWNYGDVKAYAPWVAKMKPADRLVIPGDSTTRPNIPQLEWNYGVSGLWIGRTPRAANPSAK